MASKGWIIAGVVALILAGMFVYYMRKGALEAGGPNGTKTLQEKYFVYQYTILNRADATAISKATVMAIMPQFSNVIDILLKKYNYDELLKGGRPDIASDFVAAMKQTGILGDFIFSMQSSQYTGDPAPLRECVYKYANSLPVGITFDDMLPGSTACRKSLTK